MTNPIQNSLDHCYTPAILTLLHTGLRDIMKQKADRATFFVSTLWECFFYILRIKLHVPPSSYIGIYNLVPTLLSESSSILPLLFLLLSVIPHLVVLLFLDCASTCLSKAWRLSLLCAWHSVHSHISSGYSTKFKSLFRCHLLTLWMTLIFFIMFVSNWQYSVRLLV